MWSARVWSSAPQHAAQHHADRGADDEWDGASDGDEWRNGYSGLRGLCHALLSPEPATWPDCGHGQPQRAQEPTRAGGDRCTRLRVVVSASYSPDLSPIEAAFSKLKALVRRAQARTYEALENAIAMALDQITAADARGYFGHCGYQLPTSSAHYL